VELTAENSQDSNCQLFSGELTQNACTTNLVDCPLGPVNTTFCYDDNAIEEYTYVSSDGSELVLTVNSGNVENIFDEFIVLDSDGTELYNGYGNQGDLSGLIFQSSGDSITVQVVSDFTINCQTQADINPIDISVSCKSLNFISGRVSYNETAANCVNADNKLSNYMVNISDGNEHISVAVDENGEYFAALSSGTYSLDVLNISDHFTSVTGTHTVNLSGQNQMIEDMDFCITTSNQIEDLSVEVCPLEDAVPGFETEYQILVTNNGTHVAPNAQVNFEYDGNLQSFISSSETPAFSTTNLLTFDLNDIEPFSTTAFKITMVNADSPTLNSGEMLIFNTEVTPGTNDNNFDDNLSVHQQTVVDTNASNDIMVVQGEEITIDNIDQYLTYRIRFQNLGTATANDLSITNIISDKLDWTTFHPTSSSHDYRLEIVNGVEVNYYFDNINLPNQTMAPEDSKGYITYKIKPKPDVQIGDIIENSVDIIFDANLTISTNTISTTIVDVLSTDVFETERISIYPNPVNNVLHIDWPSQLKVDSITLFDLNGKRIESFGSQNILDLSQVQSGIYILSIKTDKGRFFEKLLKE
jgi:uncharacterized repeat protein (TIGR01451 family)